MLLSPRNGAFVFLPLQSSDLVTTAKAASACLARAYLLLEPSQHPARKQPMTPAGVPTDREHGPSLETQGLISATLSLVCDKATMNHYNYLQTIGKV